MNVQRVALAFVAAVVALLVFVDAVRAEGEVPTQVAIQPLEPVVVGATVHVVVELRRADDALIPDEPVALTIDGDHVRRSRTKADGTTNIRISRELTPGFYTLEASYGGRRNAYLSSSAVILLEVRPFELAVNTVPALPGMVFSLDGERFVADGDGVARLAVGRAGEHQLAVHEDEHQDDAMRAEFSRWNTELFGPQIVLRIPYDRELQAGFDIHLRASQRFVDIDRQPIDASRVTTITLRSSLGIAYEHPDGGERWYKASRAVRRPSGLESVEVRYNVDEVVVDGSNVVNAGQQRFYLGADDPWVIELLLFSATMETSDALFGFAAGNVVDVIYPDGHTERVEPDADGALVVRGLARGQYRMKVADAPGWAPAVPVALSRDQEVVLRVVTYVDMGAAFVVASGLALGLLHIGRPHLIPGTVGGFGRGARMVMSSPIRLAAVVQGPRRRRLWQAERVADPGVPAGPVRISLSQVVAASLAAQPVAIETEPRTVALSEPEYPRESARAPWAAPMPLPSIGRRIEPPKQAELGSSVPALVHVAPSPTLGPTAAPAGRLATASPVSPAPASKSLEPASSATSPKTPVNAAARSKTKPVTKAPVGKTTTLTTGATSGREATSSKPPRRRTTSTPSTTTTRTPARKAPVPAAKTARAAAVTAPKVAAEPVKTAPAATTAASTAAATRAKTPRAAKLGAKKTAATRAKTPRAAKPGAKKTAATRARTPRAATTAASTAAATRVEKRAVTRAKTAPVTTTAATKAGMTSGGAPATRRAKNVAASRAEVTSRPMAPSARRTEAQSTVKASTTKASRPGNAAATGRARSASRSARVRAPKAATDPSPRRERLDDAIDGVLQERLEWVASKSDAPTLRRAQLAALGLSDPGEGPLRDGSPLLPRYALPAPPDSARHQPSDSWRVPVTMDEGMHGCEQCGMPLWGGMRFCRRCGWLQLPEPSKSTLQPSAAGSAHGQGPAKDLKTALAGVRGRRRNSAKGAAG